MQELLYYGYREIIGFYVGADGYVCKFYDSFGLEVTEICRIRFVLIC